MKILLGDKFYKYNKETDTVKIIRIKTIKNENSFVAYDEKTKEVIRITKQEIFDLGYTRLKPDGCILFTVVLLQDNMKDVIVSLYRTKDENNGIPYCICRQNIYDLFANQIQKNNIHYIGMSISIDTCPVDVEYQIMLACNGIDKSTMISYYIGDTLDDILSFIKLDKFDIVLKTMYDKIDIRNNTIRGYCSNVRDLLTQNNFMWDVLRGYNIYQTPFEIIVIEDQLDPAQRMVLEDMLKVEMFQTYVIKYDKDINLNDIKREYVLVSDIKDNVYIVAYDKGEYINRIYRDNIKDKRDAQLLLKYKKITK